MPRSPCSTTPAGLIALWNVGNDGTIVAEGPGTSRPVSIWDMRRAASMFGPANRRAFFSLLRQINGGHGSAVTDMVSIHEDGSPITVRVLAWAEPATENSVRCGIAATGISDLGQELRELRDSQQEAAKQLVELTRTKARLENQTRTLMETAQKLTETREELDEANRGKSNFLSYMSHELRTPLNAIIGFSEVITKESFGPLGSDRYREYTEDIFEAGRHLLDLINDVLDFSKIEAGREELYEQEISVAGVVESCKRILHDRIGRSDLSLRVDLAPSPPRLLADERKVKQILLNLLTNAVKYTPEQGEIHLAVYQPEFGGIIFEVSDNGIGIAPEDIPKALGMFGQIKDAYSTQQEGTGLGLPLSRSLAELHGGTLEIESDRGRGTTVKVWFPEERVIIPRTSRQTQTGGAFS